MDIDACMRRARGSSSSSSSSSSSILLSEQMDDVRRGPWTVEEDMKLINYIAANAEGRWNSLARAAGLKRTGKSCRLRWVNYLRPDVRRGNITLQEQLLILQLHSCWGNRWSRIAEQLPGRTDNEIKNYWRTRVLKHAKQMRCDVNSKQFKDTVRYLWIPRLLERNIQVASADTSNYNQSSSCTTTHAAAPSSSHMMITDYQTTTLASTTVTAMSDITNSNDHHQDHVADAGQQEIVGDYFDDFFCIPPVDNDQINAACWTTNHDDFDNVWSTTTSFLHQHLNY